MGGLFFLIIIITTGAVQIYNAGGDAREDKIMAKLQKERADHLEKTQKELIKIQNDFNQTLMEIENDAKNDDLAIGNALRNQLKRLR